MANYELGNLVWRIRGDSTDFDKTLTSSNDRLKSFGDRMTAIGGNLTKFVTLPLAALAGVAVKSASDLVESLNAVRVVFGDAAPKLVEFGENAAEAVGLSQSSFNELATVIGAQLKQSGLDIDDVADRTLELTQRSADLASVFNVEVTESTRALGAALRGETEPARRFGINISDAAIQAEALATGLISSTSEMTEQLKVQVRYNLIMKQSQDVAGDFANTSSNLANGTRILKAEIANVAAELGQEFLPIAQRVVSAARDLVRGFSELDDGTKRLLVALGVIAAAAGPLFLAIGALVKLKAAIIAINTAALFGPAGIIIGLAAVTAGLIAIGAARRRSQLEEIAEEFADVAIASELAAVEIEAIQDALRLGSFDGFTDARYQVDELAKNLGVSRLAVIDIGLKSESVTDAYKEQLLALRAQAVEQAALAAYADVWVGEAQRRAAAEARAQELLAQRRQAEADAAEAQRVAALERRENERVAAEEELARRAGVEEAIARQYELERLFGDQIDLNSSLQRIYRQEIERLLEQGLRPESEEIERLLRLYRELIEVENEIILTKRERSKVVEKLGKIEEEAAAESVAVLGHQLMEQVQLFEEYSGTVGSIEDSIEAARQERQEAADEALRDSLARALDEYRGYASSVIGILSNLNTIRLNLLERETQAKIEALDREALGEEAYAEAVSEIRDQAAIDAWETEKELFALRKAANLAAIAMDTASAIMRAYRELGPIAGTVAGVILGVLGATQAAAVIAQPPPPRPGFALGGEFMTNGPQMIMVGDNPGGRERVSVEPVGDGSSGRPMLIAINLDGRLIAQSTTEYINNGVVRVEARR